MLDFIVMQMSKVIREKGIARHFDEKENFYFPHHGTFTWRELTQVYKSVLTTS